jgi:hypothetical protein
MGGARGIRTRAITSSPISPTYRCAYRSGAKCGCRASLTRKGASYEPPGPQPVPGRHPHRPAVGAGATKARAHPRANVTVGSQSCAWLSRHLFTGEDRVAADHQIGCTIYRVG